MDCSIIQRKVESDEAVSTTLRCEFKCKYHKNPPIKKIKRNYLSTTFIEASLILIILLKLVIKLLLNILKLLVLFSLMKILCLSLYVLKINIKH